MPVLRFGKQRFDPDLSFAHRFGIGRGRVVGTDPVPICLIEVSPHAAAATRGGALATERTGSADRCGRGVNAPLRALTVGQEAQRLLAWAPVAIRGHVVDEVGLAEPPGSLPDCRQGEVGTDSLPFNGDDVFEGAVFSVADHLPRPQLPTEACSPQEVERGLVLLHLRRGNQRGQDDPRPATVDDVVVLITEVGTTIPVRHRVASRSVVLTRKSAVRR